MKEALRIAGIFFVLVVCSASVFFVIAQSAVGSSNFNVSLSIAGAGGSNVSSTNYQTDVVIGTLSGNITGTNYNTDVGFFFGTSSVQESTLPLSAGWNLVSLTFANNETGTNKNISINAGWNLIGYSSNTSLSLENASFINDSGTSRQWKASVGNGTTQAYVAYYDASPTLLGKRKYKYVADATLSVDDTSIRTHRGYWLYANESGNLSLPSVGGAGESDTFAWSSLVFSNGSVEKNVSDADALGWIFTSSGVGSYISYWDDSEFKEVSGNAFTRDADVLSSWRGYFIYSNLDNITLIRRN